MVRNDSPVAIITVAAQTRSWPYWRPSSGKMLSVGELAKINIDLRRSGSSAGANSQLRHKHGGGE